MNIHDLINQNDKLTTNFVFFACYIGYKNAEKILNYVDNPQIERLIIDMPDINTDLFNVLNKFCYKNTKDGSLFDRFSFFSFKQHTKYYVISMVKHNVDSIKTPDTLLVYNSINVLIYNSFRCLVEIVKRYVSNKHCKIDNFQTIDYAKLLFNKVLNNDHTQVSMPDIFTSEKWID